MKNEFQHYHLIDEKRAAEFLGVSHRTMQSWRVTGGGPEFRRLAPRMIRYCYQDLIAWADSKRHCNTMEY